eukprot:10411.XXX_461843_462085_1 [CDS] Oithona nana genome sequencing.
MASQISTHISGMNMIDDHIFQIRILTKFLLLDSGQSTQSNLGHSIGVIRPSFGHMISSIGCLHKVSHQVVEFFICQGRPT